jgi:hypothetical protein
VLSRKGRTVLLSMLRPSSRVYRKFDSVLLLAEGSHLAAGVRPEWWRAIKRLRGSVQRAKLDGGNPCLAYRICVFLRVKP